MTHVSDMLAGRSPPRKAVSARFEYTRLTGKELSEDLSDLGMEPKTFCRIFGVNPNVMTRWLKDEQEPPPWVHVAMALLFLPGAIPEARKAAAEHIKIDREHPEKGEFPFLRADSGQDAE